MLDSTAVSSRKISKHKRAMTVNFMYKRCEVYEHANTQHNRWTRMISMIAKFACKSVSLMKGIKCTCQQ